MRLKLFYLVFVLAVIKLAASQDDCPPNEVFGNTINPCGTCEQRGFCPEETEETCECSQGFFRNSDGICIPPDECPAPQSFAPLPAQPSPSYPQPPPPSYGRPQPPPPSYGGRPPQPPYNRPPPPPYGRPPPPRPPPRPRCPPNQEFTDCGTACRPTCENPNPVCTTECVRGCFCRRGYVTRGGRCIPLSSCPPVVQCPPNEVFAECGSACQATCRNRRPICPAVCVRGCSCRPGLIRLNGVCVRPEQCPPEIPPTTPPPPTVTPPLNTEGCPNWQLCRTSCLNRGFRMGFCVGPRFLRCNCIQ